MGYLRPAEYLDRRLSLQTVVNDKIYIYKKQSLWIHWCLLLMSNFGCGYETKALLSFIIWKLKKTLPNRTFYFPKAKGLKNHIAPSTFSEEKFHDLLRRPPCCTIKSSIIVSSGRYFISRRYLCFDYSGIYTFVLSKSIPPTPSPHIRSTFFASLFISILHHCITRYHLMHSCGIEY